MKILKPQLGPGPGALHRWLAPANHMPLAQAHLHGTPRLLKKVPPQFCCVHRQHRVPTLGLAQPGPAPRLAWAPGGRGAAAPRQGGVGWATHFATTKQGSAPAGPTPKPPQTRHKNATNQTNVCNKHRKTFGAVPTSFCACSWRTPVARPHIAGHGALFFSNHFSAGFCMWPGAAPGQRQQPSVWLASW